MYLLKRQFSARLSQEELDKINSNLHLVVEPDFDGTTRELIVKVFDKAFGAYKNSSDVENLDKINKDLMEELESTIGKAQNLQTDLLRAKNKINEIEKENDRALILNYDDEIKNELQTIFLVCKLRGWANSQEEMFLKILRSFQAQGQLIPDENDVKAVADYIEKMED